MSTPKKPSNKGSANLSNGSTSVRVPSSGSKAPSHGAVRPQGQQRPAAVAAKAQPKTDFAKSRSAPGAVAVRTPSAPAKVESKAAKVAISKEDDDDAAFEGDFGSDDDAIDFDEMDSLEGDDEGDDAGDMSDSEVESMLAGVVGQKGNASAPKQKSGSKEAKVEPKQKAAADAKPQKPEGRQQKSEVKQAKVETKKPSGESEVKAKPASSSDIKVLNAEDVDEEERKKRTVTFASLGLADVLCEACADMKWKNPSDIQREAIPHALAGRDIIGLAETGSGKTGAFGLPIIDALLKAPTSQQRLFALVLAPTRELAVQIGDQLRALGSTIDAQVAVILGGVDMMEQQIMLAKKPHIIVATPGRIVDHLENTNGFNLRSLKYLVLDEADRLLDMDFEKPIMKILEQIPRAPIRRTFLFSATMTTKVEKLQRASLHNPVKVEVSRKYQTVKGLVQQYLFMPAKHKDCYLAYVLQELAGQSVIIFTGKCENAQRVAIMLRNLGFSAIPLHGKMTQPKRLGALNKFRSGDRSILIATDVASRGLDIPQVDVVINFDVPTHSKDYIHRVGRTARAGRSGRAVSFVTQYDVELIQRIEQLIGKQLELYPTEEDMVMVLLERVSEAQRIAAMEIRERDRDKKDRKRSRGEFEGGEDDDGEGAGGLGHKGEHTVAGGGSRGRGGGRGGRGGGRGGGRPFKKQRTR